MIERKGWPPGLTFGTIDEMKDTSFVWAESNDFESDDLEPRPCFDVPCPPFKEVTLEARPMTPEEYLTVVAVGRVVSGLGEFAEVDLDSGTSVPEIRP